MSKLMGLQTAFTLWHNFVKLGLFEQKGFHNTLQRNAYFASL
jgi:hypothetical protein